MAGTAGIFSGTKQGVICTSLLAGTIYFDGTGQYDTELTPLIKECLSSRGMALNTTCLRCHRESKSITLALRDCALVKPTWYQLGIGTSDTLFFTQDTRDWIASNANRSERQFKLLINLLGTLPFLSLFGLFGDRETKLFSITGTLIQTWPSLSFRKPQNFSCVPII